MPVYRKVNKDFFKRWSPEMAYMLGFFAADGTITVNQRGSQYFVLQIADEGLLSKMRALLDSEHKISKRIHKKNHSIFYRLQIGSNEICKDLRLLGFGERKAKRMRIPNIPNKYFRHFLRGYFDGDGNVWIGFVHKSRKKQTYVIQTSFTSASKGFLEDLLSILKEYGVMGGGICKKQADAYCLKLSIKDSLLLYEIMYGNLGSDLFLSRKKEKFESFLKVRKKRSGSSTG